MSGQRRTADAIVGATTFSTLLGGVWMISPDLRAAIGNVFTGNPADRLGALLSPAIDFVHGLARMASDYSSDNAPLVGFGIVAVFLTVMMAKS